MGQDGKYNVERHYMLPEETQELIRQGKLSEQEIHEALENLSKVSKGTMVACSYMEIKGRVIPRDEMAQIRAEEAKEKANG